MNYRSRQTRIDTPHRSPVSVSPCSSPEPEAEVAELLSANLVASLTSRLRHFLSRNPTETEEAAEVEVVGQPVTVAPAVVQRALLEPEVQLTRNPHATENPQPAAGVLEQRADEGDEREPLQEPEAAADTTTRAAALAVPASPVYTPTDSEEEAEEATRLDEALGLDTVPGPPLTTPPDVPDAVPPPPSQPPPEEPAPNHTPTDNQQPRWPIGSLHGDSANRWRRLADTDREMARAGVGAAERDAEPRTVGRADVFLCLCPERWRGLHAQGCPLRDELYEKFARRMQARAAQRNAQTGRGPGVVVATVGERPLRATTAPATPSASAP